MTPASTPEALVEALTRNIAGTLLPGDLDYLNLEYVLRRGYAAVGCPPNSASKMCRRLAECQAEDQADADAFRIALATATAEAASLRAEVEALREDAARLDFLDGCNARLNASYGTHYGWKLVLNHNVNRLMLGDMKVDLHDSEGGNDKLPSCRLAIDEARNRTALARAATAGEGRSDG